MFRLIACLALALALVAAPALSEPAQERRMIIAGEGEARAAPDVATVRIGVETEAKTASEAMAANSGRAAKLIEEAKAQGVAPADIQTAGLSVRPIYENRRDGEAGAPRIVAYGVSNVVTVRLRDLSGAGAAIGALVGAGANRLDGVEFGFADDAKLRNEARRRAVADAAAKARLYAEAADVTLGPILTIEEAGGGFEPRPQYRAMAEAAAPLEAGESALTARVTIVWAIGTGE